MNHLHVGWRWPGYNDRSARPPECNHPYCNAHLLHELQAIYEADQRQRWRWQMMRLLGTAWALVKTAHQTGQSQLPPHNLLDRIIEHKAAYLRFVTDFRMLFDTNLAERDLRMSKLQQKISGCFRTDHGANIFCHIRGYISTLRKQGHDLLPALLSLWSDTPFMPLPTE